MTTDQRLARCLDALSHIQESAHCVDTRRFVSRLLRELEEESPVTMRSARSPERPREHLHDVGKAAR